MTSSIALAATGGAVATGVSVAPASFETAASDLAATVTAPSAPESGAASSTAPEAGSGAVDAGKRRAEGEAVETPAAAAGSLGDARHRAPVSRSADRRALADPAKLAALEPAEGAAITVTEDISDSDPREIAKALMPSYGFSVSSEFGCLDSLYMSESGWRVDADNPYSSAYGIPQAMTSVHELPADYYTSAESQLRWGLDYIERVYGTPCSAWSFKQANNWY